MDDTDAVIYAGIDEAGYGPRLGPLCTAMTIFRVAGWREGERAPDLWKRLRCVVSRDARHAVRGRLAIADSKKLKGPNSSTRRHPLTHLEAGVLTFLGASHSKPALPRTDGDLLRQVLGSQWSPPDWYHPEPTALPVSTSADLLRLRAASAAAACAGAGVEPLGMHAVVTDERMLNEAVGKGATKGDVGLAAVGELLRCVWERFATAQGSPAAPRVVIDRQGGRTQYGPFLSDALGGARVVSTAESPAESRYELVGVSRGGSPRTLAVHVRVQAEDHHLPVALASMLAKYLRELLMARFNRYWGERITELRPTAGYGLDAARWLREAGPSLSRIERQDLVRRA